MALYVSLDRPFSGFPLARPPPQSPHQSTTQPNQNQQFAFGFYARQTFVESYV